MKSSQQSAIEVDYDPFAQSELQRVVPTTEPQREVWLAVQLGDDASLSFNESITLRLSGPLQVESLQSALFGLSNRHEALRATFAEDGQSMLIAARANLRANLIDLHGESEDIQRQTVSRLRADAVETPFDLVNGPLIRATLVAYGPARHELILTSHHIVCDGWSFGVLAKDLVALYDQVASKATTPLPPPDSFADYALAQLDDEHVATAEVDLQYWLGQYSEPAPVIELPNDRPRATLRGFASRREDLLLDTNLVRAIKSFGAKHGASTFVTLFTIFGGLIGRLARCEDLVIGVSAAGQAVEGKHSLVGHCVNMLPVRMHIDLEQPVSQQLDQVRSTVLDAHDHQSCTFGTLLKRLKLPRDTSRPSLVSVVFNLDSAILSSDISTNQLQGILHSNPRHFENFELFLNASENSDGIVLELQYNTALFDLTTIQRWLRLFKSALERVIANPSTFAADVFGPDAVDAAMIADFNRTTRQYESGLLLGDLLLRGMREHPNDTALVFEDRHVSFIELEGLAWSVATQLRQRGATPGTLVGVCLERSVEMVAALVGVILSGSAYVPLDPTVPTDRLEQMALDANLHLVLTKQQEYARASAGIPAETEVILLDGLQKSEPAKLVGVPSDPAYVIFTSGSTGRPKGAMNAHSGIVNRLQWMQEAYQLVPGDRVIQKTPFTFDVSVWEFFWPLMASATLVVARPEGHRDSSYLVELITNERVTLMHFVPSMLRLFLAEPAVSSCVSLRRVVCSGEALPADLVEQFFSHLPTVKLANLYGPTEAAVDVTSWECQPTDRSGTVPIGRPIANTTMHVLDERLRPLPIGVPGDLYIGGVQVGMGYVARPELTAERFLPDPTDPPGRIYKTGDVATWRADGALMYLGRSDFQVKLRGYRIELGEIESQLQRHAMVGACVVVTWTDPSADVRLIAYVVPSGSSVPDGNLLREFLRKSLPDYMVPQHIITLNTMPLLSSGKVDRRALPPPTFDAGSGSARIPPETEVERRVLDTIERVLRLPDLGITDDFFSLGGHSLLAARLVAQLNREHNLTLPLSIVFQAPTAARLAEAVEKAKASNTPSRAPLVASADQKQAPVTVMQQRVKFIEDLRPGTVVYNVPSAHRLRGPLDVAKFRQALQMMVNRQATLRTVIATMPGGTAGGYVQFIQESVTVNLPFVDLGGIPAAQRESALMDRMQAVIDTPIALDSAPLMHVALYRLSEHEHVFLFITHHLIWDGWSFDLLYNELAEFYGALVEDRPHRLAPLAITYADFARWHNEWLRGEEFAQQLAFWKSHYRSLPPGMLPRTDHPRTGQMSGAGATLWVRIPKERTDRLRDLARQYDVTLNMLCMSAFAVVFATALGQRQAVLGVPVRGRLEGALEPIMGFFTNLIPVHVSIDSGTSFADNLAATKELLIKLFGRADVPFERLVQEPEVAEHIRSGGLYQALFSFQDARERRREWGPLHHENVLVKQHAATQDLGLWLMEGPGGMEGGLMYNADLYEEATVSVLHKAFLTALDLIEHDPRQSLATGLVSVAPQLAGWLAPAKASGQPVESESSEKMESRLRQLEQQGRSISQVPVADSHIDLGEIETALVSHPAIAQSVVMAREDAPGDVRLVAYFTPRGITPDAKALRDHLRPILPTHMLPQHFVPLDQFPVLPDGKIDLTALPAPSMATARKESRSGTAPQSEMEKLLVSIWSELLNTPEVSPDDNFFDLGGSSLLAMQVLLSMESKTGKRVNPQHLFFETLRQLARTYDAAVVENAPPKGSLNRIRAALFGNRK